MQKEEYKIIKHLRDIEDNLKQPAEIDTGLLRNPKEIIKTVNFYSLDKYLSGNQDEVGRDKPFFNVGNFRVTTAKVGSDVDVKDLRYESDSLDVSTQTMLINHELYKRFKAMNFSETLNDFGKTRPKYGDVILKKTYDEKGRVQIGVVEFANITIDSKDFDNGTRIEEHYISPSVFMSKSEWKNKEQVMKEYKKLNKTGTEFIKIKEVTGTFPDEYYEVDGYRSKDSTEYFVGCFYIACVGDKDIYLYNEKIKSMRDKYRRLSWEKVKKSLGRGVIEEGFEAQWAINDTIIDHKKIMNLSGKAVILTDDKKLEGNNVHNLDTGTFLKVTPGTNTNLLNLTPTSVPELRNAIEIWNQQYDKNVSVYDSNTGEAPVSGTPYSQTALLNQVANSPFEYQREVAGIFLAEVINDWLLDDVKKEIRKPHYLIDEYSSKELQAIDKSIKEWNKVQYFKDKMLTGKGVSIEELDIIAEKAGIELGKKGSKRQIEIPEGYLDVDGKITMNITGELKNKQAILQSLDTVITRIMSSLNPNTGKYMALEDPVLAELFGKIIEISGVPISFDTIKYLSSSQQGSVTGEASTSPDLSTVSSPIAPVAPLPANV